MATAADAKHRRTAGAADATGKCGRRGRRRQTPPSSHVFGAASIAANSASDDADAAAAHHVDLHAGFVQRTQHAGVIGPAGPVAAQQNRGSQVW